MRKLLLLACLLTSISFIYAQNGLMASNLKRFDNITVRAKITGDRFIENEELMQKMVSDLWRYGISVQKSKHGNDLPMVMIWVDNWHDIGVWSYNFWLEAFDIIDGKEVIIYRSLINSGGGIELNYRERRKILLSTYQKTITAFAEDWSKENR